MASARRAHSAWTRLFDHLTEAGVVDGNRMAGVPKATVRATADGVTGGATTSGRCRATRRRSGGC
jgi:hypothetical protein